MCGVFVYNYTFTKVVEDRFNRANENPLNPSNWYKGPNVVGEGTAAQVINDGVLVGNVVCYLQLAGIASPEPDSSGNGNFGTLTGTTAGPFSVSDSRATGGNGSRIVQGTQTYDVSNNKSTTPPVDCRAAGPVVPCGVGVYPQNSRKSGTFGPGN